MSESVDKEMKQIPPRSIVQQKLEWKGCCIPILSCNTSISTALFDLVASLLQTVGTIDQTFVQKEASMSSQGLTV